MNVASSFAQTCAIILGAILVHPGCTLMLCGCRSAHGHVPHQRGCRRHHVSTPLNGHRVCLGHTRRFISHTDGAPLVQPILGPESGQSAPIRSCELSVSTRSEGRNAGLLPFVNKTPSRPTDGHKRGVGVVSDHRDVVAITTRRNLGNIQSPDGATNGAPVVSFGRRWIHYRSTCIG